MYLYITYTTGCIVGLFAGCNSISEQLLSGVVISSSPTEIKVAFDDLPSDVDFHLHAGKLQLVKMANSVTYKRMRK